MFILYGENLEEILFLIKAYVYDSKKDYDEIKVLSKTKKMRKQRKKK